MGLRDWRIVKISLSAPHSVLSHGPSSKWNYLFQMVHHIFDLFIPLERAIHHIYNPFVTGYCPPFDLGCSLLSFPLCLGGNGLTTLYKGKVVLTHLPTAAQQSSWTSNSAPLDLSCSISIAHGPGASSGLATFERAWFSWCSMPAIWLNACIAAKALCVCVCVCVWYLLFCWEKVVLGKDFCLFDTMKFMILLLICLRRSVAMFVLSLAFSLWMGKACLIVVLLKNNGAYLNIAACGYWRLSHQQAYVFFKPYTPSDHLFSCWSAGGCGLWAYC